MLLVVTGPPGAGKSTLARRVADSFERSALVEGDAVFAFLAAGAIEPWRPESHEQNDVVIRAAAAAAGRFVEGGYITVYDGVLGPWFLPTFLDATGLEAVDYLILLPSEQTCVDRVATRSDHAFADEPATRKMHAEFAKGEIDDRHVLRDPPDDLDELTAMALDLAAGGTLTAWATDWPT